MRENWVSFCGTFFNAEELRKKLYTMRRLFFLNVSDEAEQELVTEQIKSIVSCYRAPTAKSDEEETKLNWVIILCAVARSAFASLNPTHAKKSLICEYKYAFFPFRCQMYKVFSLAINVNTIWITISKNSIIRLFDSRHGCLLRTYA